jgi:hypothetical protein
MILILFMGWKRLVNVHKTNAEVVWDEFNISIMPTVPRRHTATLLTGPGPVRALEMQQVRAYDIQEVNDCNLHFPCFFSPSASDFIMVKNSFLHSNRWDTGINTIN